MPGAVGPGHPCVRAAPPGPGPRIVEAMTDREFDLEGLDPDDTQEQLHPSPQLPQAPDPADDGFAEEPDYAENDG